MATVKVYRSNIAKSWSIERQAAVLSERLAGLKVAASYEDILSPAKLKARHPGDLHERNDAALRRTGRRVNHGEELHVASLACLAWDAVDLAGALAAASARNATVVAADAGLEIPPGYGPDMAVRIAEAFRDAKLRNQTHPGRSMGYQIAATLRREETAARIEKIRPFWHLRSPSTAELLRVAAGRDGTPMAPATAKTHLGSRKKAQQNYERKLARERRTAEAEKALSDG
jgi:hypothetical protein